MLRALQNISDPGFSLDNNLAWDGRASPFFEAYDLFCHGQNPRWGLWLRYALCHAASNKKKSAATLTALFLNAEAHKTLIKKSFDLGTTEVMHTDRFISIEDSFLSLAEAVGLAQDQQNSIKWELSFADPLVSTRIFPNLFFYLLPSPTTKFAQPRLKCLATGQIFINHVKREIKDLPVYQSHHYGTRPPFGWARASCLSFREDSSACFEALLYQPLFKGRPGRPFCFFFLIMDGKKYQANSLLKMITNKSRITDTGWELSFTKDHHRFDCHISQHPTGTVGIKNHGPSGETQHSDLSLYSRIEIAVSKKNRGRWVHIKDLTSEGCCLFEKSSLDNLDNGDSLPHDLEL